MEGEKKFTHRPFLHSSKGQNPRSETTLFFGIVQINFDTFLKLKDVRISCMDWGWGGGGNLDNAQRRSFSVIPSLSLSFHITTLIDSILPHFALSLYVYILSNMKRKVY